MKYILMPALGRHHGARRFDHNDHLRSASGAPKWPLLKVLGFQPNAESLFAMIFGEGVLIGLLSGA